MASVPPVCGDCRTPFICRPHSAWLRCKGKVTPIQEPTPIMPETNPALALTEDSAARKDTPITSGVLDYFPAALAYVAQVSKFGNDKHNPGADRLTWSRGKSMDHADCIVRHLIDRGLTDGEGIKHSGYVAWRALALLQEELEAEGAAPGRAATFPEPAEPMVIDMGGLALTDDVRALYPDAIYRNVGGVTTQTAVAPSHEPAVDVCSDCATPISCTIAGCPR